MVSQKVKDGWDERDKARANFVKKPAAASQHTEKVSKYDETFVRFINFKPNDAQKEMYNEWLQSADIWGLLDVLGEDGFKLTVKFDETSKAFNALLMDRRKSSPVQGCLLSVRASTLSVAIARLVFVHVALAGENWERLSLPVEEDW